MKTGWILIAVGLVLAGITLLLTNDAVAPDTVKEEMKTYSSEVYGVSFQYPSLYFLQERQVDENHFAVILIEDTESNRAIVEGRGPAGEGPTAITLDIYPESAHEGGDIWVRGSTQSNFNLSPDSVITPTTVGGMPSHAYRWSGLYEGESVVTVRDASAYMFSATHLTPSDPIRTHFTDLLSSVVFK